MQDEFAEEGYHPLDLVVEQKKRISSLEEENRRMREALDGIRQYGADTLSGRADGPDDRQWQRDGVLEMTRRARATLSQEEKP